jgi:hypothetical protein
MILTEALEYLETVVEQHSEEDRKLAGGTPARTEQAWELVRDVAQKSIGALLIGGGHNWREMGIHTGVGVEENEVCRGCGATRYVCQDQGELTVEFSPGDGSCDDDED